jgi:hypothetical protein
MRGLSDLRGLCALGSDHQQAKAHDILAEVAEQVGSHQHAAAAALRSTRMPPDLVDAPAAVTDSPAYSG